MANPFFNASGSPGVGSSGSPSVIRSEFANIEAGFDKFPALDANKWIVGDALAQGAEGINGDSTTWTPTLTAETAGNLNVVYSTRTAQKTRMGRYTLISGRIVTSTFTHTTASGALRITGLGVTEQSTLFNSHLGFVHTGGFTATGKTQFNPVVLSGVICIQAIGAGDGSTSLIQITAFPTGVNVDIRFCLECFANAD